jgi:hypothetical protein
MSRMVRTARALAGASFMLCAVPLAAQVPVECAGTARQTKSITLAGGPTQISAIYPGMQLLMFTNFSNTQPTCLVAHFSALSRITDNQVHYQVLLDGVPMQGHAPGLGPSVVWNALDDVLLVDNHEQDSDPTKNTSFNFFQSLPAGNHNVRVLVSAGSNIDPANKPSTQSPVLTLVY